MKSAGGTLPPIPISNYSNFHIETAKSRLKAEVNMKHHVMLLSSVIAIAE